MTGYCAAAEFLLRPASEADLDAVVETLRRSFLASYGRFMPWEYIRQWTVDDLAANFARSALSRLTVAESDGEIAGVSLAERARLNELWVHPDHTRLGIGTLLVRHEEAKLAGQGYRQIALNVYEANTAARSFYRGLGFITADSFLTRNIPGGPLRVLVKTKQLGPAGR